MGAKRRTATRKKRTTRAALIQCYGLFRRERDVYWGERGKKGNLLGRPFNSKKGNPIDFRDQTGIYVLYDGYKVLYVGQAGYGNAKLFDRLKEHFVDHLAERWNRFSWFGLRWPKRDGKLSAERKVRHPPIAEILNHTEAILIAATEPPMNRQGGRWGKAVQYVQSEDPEMELLLEGKVDEIHEWMIEQKEATEKGKAKKKKA